MPPLFPHAAHPHCLPQRRPPHRQGALVPARQWWVAPRIHRVARLGRNIGNLDDVIVAARGGKTATPLSERERRFAGAASQPVVAS